LFHVSQRKDIWGIIQNNLSTGKLLDEPLLEREKEINERNKLEKGVVHIIKTLKEMNLSIHVLSFSRSCEATLKYLQGSVIS